MVRTRKQYKIILGTNRTLEMTPVNGNHEVSSSAHPDESANLVNDQSNGQDNVQMQEFV